MIKNLKAEVAKEWIENGDACLIDVRELSEHKAQSIKGSCLIPSGKFCENELPADAKKKKIIIHCQRGGRASRACAQLMKENPELDVYNLEGGILGWAEQGFETATSSKKAVMSLERQVRLSAGILVFVGCILAIFVNFSFIAIPAFVGFGLAFTAIIDWCGMAKILAYMPWNQ
jgi:rhodanese-related sulfurtransferase